MSNEAYQAGFHAFMFPKDSGAYINEADPDWLEGWHAAKDFLDNTELKPPLRAMLTDDGRIDMFILGPDGVPVARIAEPTATGEEAEILARAWIAEQKEAQDDHA